ncbi:flavodoxin [uncultured Megasphaera sp.]|uniref:flavodoxin n=1 Tax=uncultured Megasphaera sp. TaxID=165188 RepID=UPI002659C865|nr:flavodoxin [uncultured Megasphaera sp.]
MNCKKMGLLAAAGLLVFSLAACGAASTKADDTAGATKTAQTASVDADAGASVKGAPVPAGAQDGKETKQAVIYFSEPEVENPDTVQGSTQYIAQIIQEQTKADIFRISRKDPYPTNHAALVAAAKAEKLQDARPDITDPVGDLSAYDTIYLGYPIWWGDLPMPVYTFLQRHDLTGKKIVIFSTHGGSGLAGTPEAVQNAVPGASVQTNAFTVSRDDVAQAKDSVLSWLASL